MKKTLLFAALMLGIMGNAKADDGITTATYGNATGNTTRTMTLALTHETNDYVAFQLDLTLPEGTSVDATKITAKSPMKAGGTVTIDGTEYSTNFIFDGATQTDGTYRIIGYNLGNVEVSGTSGDICLTLPLTTTEGITFDANTVTASNIIFVESAGLTEVNMTAATTDSRLWGDVVRNKSVDATDYQAVANIVTKIGNGTTEIDSFAADVDQSDAIDATDYQAIGNIVTGK